VQEVWPMKLTRLFLLAGQSNMQGVGTADSVEMTNCLAPAQVALFEDLQFRPLLWRSTFGPELGLAAELGRLHPDERLVLIKLARSRLSLRDDWSPGVRTRGHHENNRGAWFRRLCRITAAVANACRERGEEISLGALFWMQGERDADDSDMAAAYAENLAQLVHRLRGRLGEPRLPVLIGAIPREPVEFLNGVVRFAHGAQVNDAQQRVATELTDVAMVDTQGLATTDGVHYDSPSLLELGRRFAAAYTSLAGERESTAG
jgi:Carbohydrate esterase, sialic acid-specific acetylesterase